MSHSRYTVHVIRARLLIGIKVSTSFSKSVPRMPKKRKVDELQTVFFDLGSSESFIRQESLTEDHRRIRQRKVTVQPPSPKKTSVVDAILSLHDSTPFDWDDSSFNPLLSGASEDQQPGVEVDYSDRDDRAKEATRKSASSAKPMNSWLNLATKFLKQLMYNEGRGERDRRKCCQCADSSNQDWYRCRSCWGRDLWCASCIKEAHACRPFDVIEKWNGSFFERSSLAKLGLVVQLGHSIGTKCPNPKRLRTGFVVVDMHGVHENVLVNKCECKDVSEAGELWEQLLRYGLYPAMVEDPRTAFAFPVLSHFHTLTLQGKVSLYDYYHALEALTDGSGVEEVKDRYEAFIRVMRQWRFLKLLKRGGIGNDPTRELAEVKDGELCVPCLACPRPGINLPDDWETSTPLSKQFLYHKFISLDACFRLKRRKISTEKKDPGLYTGMAYYVPQPAYQEWMKTVPEQKDTSSCNSLAAVQQANTKYNRGYATTGAILCLCARHEMVEPNGTVDTSRGEKYMYSDYAVGCSQRHSYWRLLRILCYDIACQYSKKFFERMSRLPLAARIGIHKDRRKFAVPKLHIQGHERRCQEHFALNFLLGAGQTDGEGIERHWANLGPIATSTKEMGPGHCRDTLDDHFGHWNWMKTVRLGQLLFKRRREARSQCEIQSAELLDFSCAVSDSLEEWMGMVLAWESGDSEVNPYSLPHQGITEDDVRLKYAEKEAEEHKLGIPALHEVSPSAFMMLGLDIEDQQRLLSLDISENDVLTPDQKTNLLERRSRLSRGIARLRTIQQTYTPLVVPCMEGLHVAAESNEDTPVESVVLGLPSSVPDAVCNHPSLQTWIAMEVEFRRAQLSSSLHTIRNHLFVKARLNIERSLQVRHQKASTRARDNLGRLDRKILRFKGKFRAAWSALAILVGEENVGYPKLRDEDIRCLDEVDTNALRNRRKVLKRVPRAGDKDEMPLLQPGETRRVNSWIWKGVELEGDSEAMREVVRVEWCKAWACKRRWDEELELIAEEMRRTIESLKHEGRRWQGMQGDESPEGEGRAAYAARQASIRFGLASKFERMWSKPDPKPRKQVTVRDVIAEEDLEEDSMEEDNDLDI
ncbi:hypothetical protein VNI00_009136 [Paramarasmius palmivorus]|uniref:CxC2-like cysteine cluster KDZ transposase-associated domain-containing protein n=1 Tax=Paramarasmius palmivorus TaxID=297713 RepID=A0AAW0CNR9_9AGAR